MKNKIVAGIFTLLIITLMISAIHFYNQNRLKQTMDNYKHEAGKELILHATDFFDVNEEKAAQFSFDTSAVNEDTVGEYAVIASFKNKTFEIKISVVDTTAPEVEFTERYLFTNNLEAPPLDGMLAKVSEHSKWSAKLIRFEKHGSLEKLDEKELKELTNMIPLPCDSFELNNMGTEEIPTEEGIYRAVMEISDEYGNITLEEIYVIYDITGARINDTPDKTIYVEKEDLDKEPRIDKDDYTIIDNVDGKIPDEDIQCELELPDAEKHEWLVHVSYTDRAGNDSKAEFLIVVKEKQKQTTSNNGNGGSTNTTPNTGGNINARATYNPADTNMDRVVDGQESSAYISPTEQIVISAGYGNIVQLDSNTYAVLTHGDAQINGQDGGVYLINYLSTLGLQAGHVYGGWISSANDWYWIIAENITPLITSDDEGYWD